MHAKPFSRPFSLALLLHTIPKANKLPPRPKITPETELVLKEVFLKGGSGAGGQKINKTNSKVQLTHLPTGLVVTNQATRSRDQNRKIARMILAQKLQDMESPETSRTAVLIERKQKIKASKQKGSNRKQREIEEERARKLAVQQAEMDRMLEEAGLKPKRQDEAAQEGIGSRETKPSGVEKFSRGEK
ncbi:hypothetical protein BABINDRAFT_161732 [Babjeviella inositovora NRRL Y-12698]|uniref:Prokaryotic-type class I peptide chain release factors domain-containing protein n=1 Tax=Babjeviella inositovora NRRL Y-12698 TaxID=984486 RepID=A0A1E3QQH4_9ASCO|nr:uncharacterized protein BABINDRAFT_161732 [Babjeviella inositovora NRRL Y-12698]ODQ79322.1 hypothetical protein BABINDRAFT_161732 [Babjeviella inositovora NRRL Y-12698]